MTGEGSAGHRQRAGPSSSHGQDADGPVGLDWPPGWEAWATANSQRPAANSPRPAASSQQPAAGPVSESAVMQRQAVIR